MVEIKVKSGNTIKMALAAALVLAAGAFAQPMGGRADFGGGHRGPQAEMAGGMPEMGQLGGFMRILGALDLSDEQRDRIRTIAEEARGEVESLIQGSERPEGRGAMAELFASPDLSEADILELMEERDQVRDQVRRVIAAAMVDVHDILTDEQLQRLAELLEEGPHGMGQHHERSERVPMHH